MNELDFMRLGEVFADRPWIICLFIFLFTFVLEDVATVSAGLLSSYGYVMPEMAFFALLAGIILGDLGLYGLGYGASRFKWARAILHRQKVVMIHDWLDSREVLAVLAARFVPGARLPTYTAMGFFDLSFKKFAMTVFVASVIWTSILFVAIFRVGEVFVGQLEAWRLPLAIIMVLVVVLVPRCIQFFIRKEKSV
jgi:membrane protein DedA with SNARE-associated domain